MKMSFGAKPPLLSMPVPLAAALASTRASIVTAWHRHRPAALALGGALALHALLLGGHEARRWHAGPPSPAPIARLQVREVSAITRVTPVTPVAPALAAQGDPLPPRKAPPAPPRSPEAMHAQRSRTLIGATVAAEPAPRIEQRAAPPSAAAPVALAPALTLHYEARRGSATGDATLVWTRDGEGYQAALTVEIDGESVLVQESRGGTDAHGVAPQRFTDRRRRGGVRAVNFQREAGRISYSGPRIEHALAAGAQDRLSWVFQLAGLVSALGSGRADEGGLVIPVTGTGGELVEWVFRPVANAGMDDSTAGRPPENAHESGGVTPTARLYVREPAGPYDVRVEAWLDPSRHHLPLRLTLRAGPADPGLDLRLRSPAR